MRKGNVINVVILFFIGVFLYTAACKLMGFPLLGSDRTVNYLQPARIGGEFDKLPNLDFLLFDSISHINLATVPSENPIVLLYFGPDCPYCQMEVKEIIANMKYFKKVVFYLITPYSLSDLRQFREKFELEKYENIMLCQDYKFQFGKYFNTASIPYVVFYTKDKRMKAAFLGVVRFDQMKLLTRL